MGARGAQGGVSPPTLGDCPRPFPRSFVPFSHHAAFVLGIVVLLLALMKVTRLVHGPVLGPVLSFVWAVRSFVRGLVPSLMRRLKLRRGDWQVVWTLSVLVHHPILFLRDVVLEQDRAEEP